MRPIRKFKFLIFLLFFGVLSHAEEPVCQGLRFTEELSPGLSQNEKAFVCPSPQSGWGSIPISQMTLHLRGILQSRGYDTPNFQTQDGTLVVDPGPISRVSKVDFRFRGSPIPMDIPWNWKGNAITPNLLNEIEKKSASALQSRGYPCATARASVPDPRSGTVIVLIDRGKPIHLKYSEIELSNGLKKYYTTHLLSRHYAFLDDQPFDQEKLLLTAQRLETTGLFESAYFLPQCERGELSKISLRGTVGLPRLVRVGIGVDTEGIVKGRVSWRHARLWSNASTLELMALASKFRQELTGTMRWYVSDKSPRFFLSPTLSAVRRSEIHFESYSVALSFPPAMTFELPTGQLEISLGPTFQQNKTTRGPDQGDIFLLMLENRVSYLGHSLELQAADPIEGTYWQLGVAATDRAALSDVSAWRGRLFFKRLWNVGGYDPPWVVLGLRGSLNATGHAAGKLPADFRYYLGGSDSLRGFSRLELPSNGVGAFSAFYASLEARFPSILPWGFQPIVFADVGALGDEAFEFHSPLYVSPGLGMRWNSPIGVFRSTLAHGYSMGGSTSARWGRPSHWQFFIGYGEEF